MFYGLTHDIDCDFFFLYFCDAFLFLSLHQFLLLGMGLGPNGEPLRNVALNLPSLQNQNNLGGNSNNSNAPVPVAPPQSFSSAANVMNQTQNSMSSLAALNNVVGNLNSLNPLLSTLGLGSLAANTNDSSNNSALDINKIVGVAAGSSSGNSLSNVVSGGASGNFSGLGGIGAGLNQSGRLDSSLSNPYSSNTFNSLSSNLGGGLNNSGNPGFGSNQRDFDIGGSVRNYNSQSDDFSRMQSQNFGSNQLGNGSGSNNSNLGGNNRSQNISDTILIRNVRHFFIQII